MTEPRRCRMFPLGSVLVPGAPLPLHIFEPRYQQLLNETLEDDRTFGVALISRGSEVGGGDARTTVGTRALIEEHSRFDDGRAAVAARGTSRLEVVEWLPDDPYPMAMVIDRPTAASTGADAAAAEQAAFDRAMTSLDGLIQAARDARQLRDVPELTWPDDIEAATWHLTTVAPINPLDRQRILEADVVVDRLAIATEVIDAIAADLRLMARLDGD